MVGPVYDPGVVDVEERLGKVPRLPLITLLPIRSVEHLVEMLHRNAERIAQPAGERGFPRTGVSDDGNLHVLGLLPASPAAPCEPNALYCNKQN